MGRQVSVRGGNGLGSPWTIWRGENAGVVEHKPYNPLRPLQGMIQCSANTGFKAALPEGSYTAIARPEGVRKKRRNRCWARRPNDMTKEPWS